MTPASLYAALDEPPRHRRPGRSVAGGCGGVVGTRKDGDDVKNPLYSGDPRDWDGLPLTLQLDYIRRHLCTGAGGQSQDIMRQRERIRRALMEAMNAVRRDEQADSEVTT